MIRPATLPWFARHEISLVWRDFVYMMTAGKRRREPWVIVAILFFAGIIHLFALAIVVPALDAGVGMSKTTLVVISGTALLSLSMMLSQAMESVTRAFYSRADLDLILSSPASAQRVFAIRIAAIALSSVILSMVLAGPFVNVMAIYAGAQWLAAYGVLASMGAVSAAFAVAVTVALFRLLGPKRTRLIAQVVAAVVGAAFVIGIQAAAIISTGTVARIALFKSEAVVTKAPDMDSLVWLPARAAMGDLTALAIVCGVSLGLLGIAIVAFSGRFADHVIAASGVSFEPKRGRQRIAGFRQASVKRALRRKEWTLLRRDPWLVSQTLMQVLYLLPPALLLWRNFGANVDTFTIMVPVLVMAAGQLAGGLAWLAVSGEDAPDLVASAPVTARAIIQAKIESVSIAVAVVTAPIILGLALVSVRIALAALLGVIFSATSATMIQIWFRAQAKRSHFRRRQTSSRIATLAEAFASILWAAAAGLAAADSWGAPFAAGLALAVLGLVRLVRPRPQ